MGDLKKSFDHIEWIKVGAFDLYRDISHSLTVILYNVPPVVSIGRWWRKTFVSFFYFLTWHIVEKSWTVCCTRWNTFSYITRCLHLLDYFFRFYWKVVISNESPIYHLCLDRFILEQFLRQCSSANGVSFAWVKCFLCHCNNMDTTDFWSVICSQLCRYDPICDQYYCDQYYGTNGRGYSVSAGMSTELGPPPTTSFFGSSFHTFRLVSLRFSLNDTLYLLFLSSSLSLCNIFRTFFENLFTQCCLGFLIYVFVIFRCLLICFHCFTVYLFLWSERIQFYMVI